MGGGAFGVEAASQFYFGKSVREINMAEAAMLAGLFKAPTRFAPHINLPASRARANEVLSNLVEAGYYSAGQVYNARLNPAQPIENRDGNSPDWFLDFAYEEIQKKIKDKSDFVLTARTTIDVGLQEAAEQAVQSQLGRAGGRSRRRRASNITSALVSMETDGAVRAVVGGLDYGESQFNRATSAQRQPGSSFKVYVYATALENGYTSRTTLRDVSVRCGRWSPRNYNGSYGSGGRIAMTDALRRSLNTTAVATSLRVGRKKVIELTKRLGIKGIRPSCSMALGDRGITPISHVGGYATFANGGYRTAPYAILDVYNSQGALVYSRERDEPKPRRVISRAVAEQMNQMLETVVTGGTARRAQLEFTNAAGKTGTSSSYRDAWFMGYTGRYVTGVWVGRDNFKPVYRSGGRGMTGGSVPAAIWQAYMSVAHKSMDIPTIPGLAPQSGPGRRASAPRRPSCPEPQLRCYRAIRRCRQQVDQRSHQARFTTPQPRLEDRCRDRRQTAAATWPGRQTEKAGQTRSSRRCLDTWQSRSATIEVGDGATHQHTDRPNAAASPLSNCVQPDRKSRNLLPHRAWRRHGVELVCRREWHAVQYRASGPLVALDRSRAH